MSTAMRTMAGTAIMSTAHPQDPLPIMPKWPSVGIAAANKASSPKPRTTIATIQIQRDEAFVCASFIPRTEGAFPFNVPYVFVQTAATGQSV